jgi:hypothetical protein
LKEKKIEEEEEKNNTTKIECLSTKNEKLNLEKTW